MERLYQKIDEYMGVEGVPSQVPFVKGFVETVGKESKRGLENIAFIYDTEGRIKIQDTRKQEVTLEGIPGTFVIPTRKEVRVELAEKDLVVLYSGDLSQQTQPTRPAMVAEIDPRFGEYVPAIRAMAVERLNRALSRFPRPRIADFIEEKVPYFTHILHPEDGYVSKKDENSAESVDSVVNKMHSEAIIAEARRIREHNRKLKLIGKKRMQVQALQLLDDRGNAKVQVIYGPEFLKEMFEWRCG